MLVSSGHGHHQGHEVGGAGQRVVKRAVDKQVGASAGDDVGWGDDQGQAWGASRPLSTSTMRLIPLFH